MLFGKSKAGGACKNHSPGNLAAQKIREKEKIFFSVMTSCIIHINDFAKQYYGPKNKDK
jgi:hypothetical protein